MKQKKPYEKPAAEVVLFDNNDLVKTAPNPNCGGRNQAGYGESGSGFAWGSWGC